MVVFTCAAHVKTRAAFFSILDSSSSMAMPGLCQRFILIFLSGTVRVSSLVAAPHLRQPTGEMHESPTPVQASGLENWGLKLDLDPRSKRPKSKSIRQPQALRTSPSHKPFIHPRSPAAHQLNSLAPGKASHFTQGICCRGIGASSGEP